MFGILGGARADERRQPGRAARKLKAVLAATLAFAGAMTNARPLTAHHSFAAEFDASQPVRLRGAVSRVEWRNPHAWIYLAVADPAGTVVTWAIEASSPSALARRGVGRQSVLPGMTVSVSGYRAKKRTPTARGRDITLPDGRTLSLGSADAGTASQPPESRSSAADRPAGGNGANAELLPRPFATALVP